MHRDANLWRTDAEGDRQLTQVRDRFSAPTDPAAFDAGVAAAPRSGVRPQMVCIDRARNGPYLVSGTARRGVRTVYDAPTATAAVLDASHTRDLDACVDSHPLPRSHLFKRLHRRIRWNAKSWLRTAFGR